MARTRASDYEDTEITLGTGKLLGLFLLLAAVCGVFFSIGYSLGKSSAKEQALNDQATNPPAETTSVDNGKKPSAVVAVKAQPEQDDTANPKPGGDLTFYKSVQQNQPNTQLTQSQEPAAATTTKAPAASTTASTEAPSAPAPNASATVPPQTTQATTSADQGAFMVQIAAVSKEQDAEALANALKKKSYNVFVVNNPAGTDKLFHVQVGPFASLADAQAMKAKLTGDGYNPIVKR